LPQAEVDSVVHIEPITSPTETVAQTIHSLVEQHGLHAHDIHVREVDEHLEADFDLEVPPDLALTEAHILASQVEQAVVQAN